MASKNVKIHEQGHAGRTGISEISRQSPNLPETKVGERSSRLCRRYQNWSQFSVT